MPGELSSLTVSLKQACRFMSSKQWDDTSLFPGEPRPKSSLKSDMEGTDLSRALFDVATFGLESSSALVRDKSCDCASPESFSLFKPRGMRCSPVEAARRTGTPRSSDSTGRKRSQPSRNARPRTTISCIPTRKSTKPGSQTSSMEQVSAAVMVIVDFSKRKLIRRDELSRDAGALLH